MKLDLSPTWPHLFSNPTGPERKRYWCVHSLQPRIGPEKSRGPADWFGRCSITFIQFIYFISLLLYIFACLIDMLFLTLAFNRSVINQFNIELLFQLRELVIKYYLLLDQSNINIQPTVYTLLSARPAITKRYILLISIKISLPFPVAPVTINEINNFSSLS